MKQNLTKKVGPLPLWAYAVILGGAFLAYRLLRTNKSSGSDGTSVQLIPTGAPPIDASAGFINELSERLDRIESNQTAPPPASTDGSDSTLNFARFLDALREQTKSITDAIAGGGSIQPTPTGSPTKTPAPVSAKPTRDNSGAFYDQRTGAWHITNWATLTAERVNDILWANIVGRGPRTGQEASPFISKISALQASGLDNEAIYYRVAPELKGVR